MQRLRSFPGEGRKEGRKEGRIVSDPVARSIGSPSSEHLEDVKEHEDRRMESGDRASARRGTRTIDGTSTWKWMEKDES